MGKHSMRHAVAALAALLFAAPAAGAEIDNVKSLDLEIRGRIAEHCAMGSIGDMDFGDIMRPGLAATAQLQLDCNIPFTMSIKARNGGFAHAQMPMGQGPYAGTLPYSIGVRMPIRRPQPATLSKEFESRQLLSGAAFSTNEGIATEGMTLAINLGTVSGEAGLLAGNYSETMIITVTPD